MATIRCPKCKHQEEFDGQGKWYVTCHDCGAKFVIYIARPQVPTRLNFPPNANKDVQRTDR
ncbi:MAG: hypothetical protein GX020_04955 [Firmicutes bacterium]|nr:hypothetical protein [Bacillota bacterium]